MFGVATSDDYKPVTWVGRFPVDVTTLLVGVHVALTIVTCFLFALGQGAFLNHLTFDSAQVLTLGRFWEIATYAFVHTPSGLLGFAIEMYMLFFFGREVERFIGRRSFITLYALLLLVPALVLTALGFWIRLGLAGSAVLHFGIFLAFATIYPGMEMMLLRIQVKWIALILVAIGTLASLASHDWGSLIVLWTTIATAFFYIRSRGIGGEIEWWTALKERLQPKPKFKVLPRANPRRTVEPEDVVDSIDPLLDKISKHGINSLTAAERRALDRARNQLLKKSE